MANIKSKLDEIDTLLETARHYMRWGFLFMLFQLTGIVLMVINFSNTRKFIFSLIVALSSFIIFKYCDEHVKKNLNKANRLLKQL